MTAFQDGLGLRQPFALNVLLGGLVVNSLKNSSEVGFRDTGTGSNLRNSQAGVENVLFQIGDTRGDPFLFGGNCRNPDFSAM